MAGPAPGPNPFEAAQKPGKPQSLRWCAWEVLKDHPEGLLPDAVLAEAVERGMEHPSIKKGLPTTLNKELGRLKQHFQRDSSGVWSIRRAGAAGQQQEEEEQAQPDPAEAEAPAAAAPPAGGEGEGEGGAFIAADVPPEALLNARCDEWWADEQRYYSGTISEVAESDDPRDAGSAQLAVLHLTYEDGTDSWVKPKRWRAKQLPGGRPLYVIEEGEVYIVTAPDGKLVLDQRGGVEEAQEPAPAEDAAATAMDMDDAADASDAAAPAEEAEAAAPAEAEAEEAGPVEAGQEEQAAAGRAPAEPEAAAPAETGAGGAAGDRGEEEAREGSPAPAARQAEPEEERPQKRRQQSPGSPREGSPTKRRRSRSPADGGSGGERPRPGSRGERAGEARAPYILPSGQASPPGRKGAAAAGTGRPSPAKPPRQEPKQSPGSRKRKEAAAGSDAEDGPASRAAARPPQAPKFTIPRRSDAEPAAPARRPAAAEGRGAREAAAPAAPAREGAQREAEHRGGSAPLERGASASAWGDSPSGQQPQQPQQQQQQQAAAAPAAPRPMPARVPDTLAQRILQEGRAHLARDRGHAKWGPSFNPLEVVPLVAPPGGPDAPAPPARRHSGWPGGTLLPGSAQVGSLGRDAPPLALPPHIKFGAIFVCNNASQPLLLQRSVLAGTHPTDIDKLDPTSTMLLLHNFESKMVYGVYKPLEWGRDLDRSLSDFPYQARVEPLHVFEPVPEDMLEGSLPRKRHKVTQERMKFFEKSLNARQCAEVWARMAMAHGKLLRSA